jgi:hypothetical protein
MVSALLSFITILSLVGTAGAGASNAVRISQVYGGGGTLSGYTAWNADYVELFNLGPTPVDLSGWALEYGTPSGAYATSANNLFVFPDGASIAPCSYLLVAMEEGLSGFPLPVTPDYSGTLQFSTTSGKVALFNTSVPNVTCGAIDPSNLVDKVSYGSANCPETASVGPLSIALVAVRNGDGTVDTDDNSSDFTRVEYAEPRSSQSPANGECLAVPARPSTWGKVKEIYRR